MIEAFTKVIKMIADIRSSVTGIKRITFEWENETIAYDHDQAREWMTQFVVVYEIVKNMNLDVAVDMLDELMRRK